MGIQYRGRSLQKVTTAMKEEHRLWGGKEHPPRSSDMVARSWPSAERRALLLRPKQDTVTYYRQTRYSYCLIHNFWPRNGRSLRPNSRLSIIDITGVFCLVQSTLSLGSYRWQKALADDRDSRHVDRAHGYDSHQASVTPFRFRGGKVVATAPSSPLVPRVSNIPTTSLRNGLVG